MMESDIIDRIDALVDEQMAGGEPQTGFDFGDPHYPKCPHCNRHWHGLRITQRIGGMYSYGSFDPNYTVAEDDSPTICEGSDFIGPQRPPSEPPQWAYDSASWRSVGYISEDPPTRYNFPRLTYSTEARWVNEAIRITINYGYEQVSRILWPEPHLPTITRVWDENWNIIEPEPCTTEAPEVDIRFGPENWLATREPVGATPMLRSTIYCRWQEFTAPSFPVPDCPGYDFSEYAKDVQHGPQRRNGGFR